MGRFVGGIKATASYEDDRLGVKEVGKEIWETRRNVHVRFFVGELVNFVM